MKSYQIVNKMEHELESIRCDVCNLLTILPIEIEKFHSINFIAGYDSKFGDGNEVECDICDTCFYNLISNFALIIKPEI